MGSDRSQHQNRHSSREFSGTNRQTSNKGWNVTEGNRPPQGGKTWADEDHLTTKGQRDERRPIKGDLRDIINERNNATRRDDAEWEGHYRNKGNSGMHRLGGNDNSNINNRRTNTKEWDDADWDDSGTNKKKQDIRHPGTSNFDNNEGKLYT